MAVVVVVVGGGVWCGAVGVTFVMLASVVSAAASHSHQHLLLRSLNARRAARSWRDDLSL